MTSFTALRRTFLAASASIVAAVFAATSVYAWHARGHSDVGAIAETALTQNHSHAAERIHAILGGLSLSQVGPWADCVRAVSGPNGSRGGAPFTYGRVDRSSSECFVFSNDSALKTEMQDYVQRNWSNCPHTGGGCHTQYHFADVALQRAGYRSGEVGTHPYDIVHAINAAVAVLRRPGCNRAQPVTAEVAVAGPFHFTCRNALMMLVHLVGDLHQPLHVGALYLDAAGHRVDPDSSPAARHLAESSGNDTTSTHGGNSLHFGSQELHGHWDETAQDAFPVAEVNAIAPTSGPRSGWAARWATESVGESRTAFASLTFSAKHGSSWDVMWGDRATYDSHMAVTQHHQIVRAGARLSQLLQSIWPG